MSTGDSQLNTAQAFFGQKKQTSTPLYRSSSTPLRLSHKDGFKEPSNGSAIGSKITPNFAPELLGGNVISTSI